ncbi:MAG: Fic family protein [Gemmataceae bacterium]
MSGFNLAITTGWPLKPDDFTPDAPGNVVRSTQGHWVYEPHPLPPQEGRLGLDFRLARELAEAERALGELAGVGRMLPNPHLLIRPFIQREAVSSSRIEGTMTRLDQLFLFEAGPDQVGHPEDVEEVQNYVRASEHGLNLIRQGQPLSLRVIREVHRVLMEGVRGGDRRPGEFRPCDVRIGRPSESWEDSRFIPPSHLRLVPILKEFESFINTPSERPAIVDLALAHYQFETIHPFMDGNGRVGRLLMVLMLCERGLLPEPLLYLSAYLETHNDEYRDHLLAVSQKAAWNGWIRFLCRGVIEQARDASMRARRLLELWRRYRDEVGAASRSAAAIRLVDMLFTQPYITVRSAAEYLSQTYAAAQNNVQKLVDATILRPLEGFANPRFFVADAILKLLDQPLMNEN